MKLRRGGGGARASKLEGQMPKQRSKDFDNPARGNTTSDSQRANQIRQSGAATFDSEDKI